MDVMDAVVAVVAEEEGVNKIIVGCTVSAAIMGESAAVPHKDTIKMPP